MNSIKNEILKPIIDIKIDHGLSIGALFALHTIFELHYTLAEVVNDSRTIPIMDICRDRVESIGKILEQQYSQSQTINEKVEILEHIEGIELFMNATHSSFAIDESENLEVLPSLTFAQKLRLSWLFGMETDNQEYNLSVIMSQINDAFDLTTAASLSMIFGTENQRQTVTDIFTDMFDSSIVKGDMRELSRLLNIGPEFWDRSPLRQNAIIKASIKATNLLAVSMPEKIVLAKIADIYSTIDRLTA